MATCSRNTTPKHRAPAPGMPWCLQRPPSSAGKKSTSAGNKQAEQELAPEPTRACTRPASPSPLLLPSSRTEKRFWGKKAELSPGSSRVWKNCFQRFQNFLSRNFRSCMLTLTRASAREQRWAHKCCTCRRCSTSWHFLVERSQYCCYRRRMESKTVRLACERHDIPGMLETPLLFSGNTETKQI